MLCGLAAFAICSLCAIFAICTISTTCVADPPALVDRESAAVELAEELREGEPPAQESIALSGILCVAPESRFTCSTLAAAAASLSWSAPAGTVSVSWVAGVVGAQWPGGSLLVPVLLILNFGAGWASPAFCFGPWPSAGGSCAVGPVAEFGGSLGAVASGVLLTSPLADFSTS